MSYLGINKIYSISHFTQNPVRRPGNIHLPSICFYTYRQVALGMLILCDVKPTTFVTFSVNFALAWSVKFVHGFVWSMCRHNWVSQWVSCCYNRVFLQRCFIDMSWLIERIWPQTYFGVNTVTCDTSYNFLFLWVLNDVTTSLMSKWAHHCLLSRIFGRWSKKTSKLRVTGLLRGIHLGPVKSPHKWPVTRKMFLFDDVIMIQRVDAVFNMSGNLTTFVVTAIPV